MKKHSTTGLLAFFCLIIFYGTAFAQTGTVRGTVKSSDGEPASHVRVFIADIKKGDMSAKDGSYEIQGLKPGTYKLSASRVGLLKKEKAITVAEGQTITADFILSENAKQLSEIVVMERRSSNERPVSAGKISISPMDLPQSVASLDRTVMEQQQMARLSEAIRNIPGIYLMGNTGGTQEEIAGRGFAYSSSNTFKNGVRFNNSVMPEMNSLDRVEVLKGSSAILFGNVAAGGVINLVTKKPGFEQGGKVALQAASYGSYRPALDVYGPILNSENFAYRVNTSYENAGSFRNNVNSERFYINPSLLVKAGDRTEILLEGDFLRDRRTSDYGTGAINYAIAAVPRETFLGAAWSYNQAQQRSATATITHRLGENWQVKGIAAYQAHQNTLFGTVRPNAGNFIQADGKWIRNVQRSEADEKYYMAEIDLSTKFSTFSVAHTLLIGADADQYHTNTLAYNTLNKYDSVNIFDLELYRQRSDIPEMTKNTLTTSPVKRAGVYIQDLVALSGELKFLAGARWSYQQTESRVLAYAKNTTTQTISFDDAITPRFGLIYQPMQSMSLFASYSNSFTLNTGVDLSGNALPPSFINQYEAGIKNDLFEGLCSANLTVYQIVNSNLAQTSLANGNTNSNIKELAGEVTSRGLELDIVSREYAGFSAIAGYSYNQTKYTRSNTYIEGSLLRYNPAHTANASIHYTVHDRESWLDGLHFGFGAFYTGERVAGRSTRLTVPNDTYRLIPIAAFTQFDLSAGYTLRNLTLRFKVSNIFNVLSYYVHDDNSVNPVAPRLFTSTISYDI